MATVKDYLKKVREAQNKVLDQVEKIIYDNEFEIVQMNTNQIANFIGTDGALLQSTSKIFSGRYTLATQLIASTQNLLAPKIAGDNYNFLATGDFFNGFSISLNGSKDKLEIINTGTGTGDKKLFFDSYPKLLGLTKENAYKLNYDIIKPELDKFLKNVLQ